MKAWIAFMERLPLAACAKTFSETVPLLRVAQRSTQRDTVMQVIKESSLATARQQDKAFPAREEATKVQHSTLILRRWRSWGSCMSLSHRHCHKCVVVALWVSADLNETGENTEERDEVFLSLRRKMTHCIGVVEVLIIPRSLVSHYQCIMEFPCRQWLCVFSVCTCVLWRLLLLSFREGETLINHVWLWSFLCLHSTPICSLSQCRALSQLSTQRHINSHTRTSTNAQA